MTGFSPWFYPFYGRGFPSWYLWQWLPRHLLYELDYQKPEGGPNLFGNISSPPGIWQFWQRLPRHVLFQLQYGRPRPRMVSSISTENIPHPSPPSSENIQPTSSSSASTSPPGIWQFWQHLPRQVLFQLQYGGKRPWQLWQHLPRQVLFQLQYGKERPTGNIYSEEISSENISQLGSGIPSENIFYPGFSSGKKYITSRGASYAIPRGITPSTFRSRRAYGAISSALTRGRY